MKTDGFPHKDVFHLVLQRTLSGMFKSDVERERAARIWAEFMSPWFAYPSNWIAEELRKSSSGDESSCAVKCKLVSCHHVLSVTCLAFLPLTNALPLIVAPGQKVQTCFGNGEIVTRIAPSNNVGLRYKVKLGYGTGYLRPSAIVHLLPATDPSQRMVRRNGVMEKFSLPEEPGNGVDLRCQLMFGTEKVYILVRIYSYLVHVLSNTQSFLLSEEGQQKETQTTNGIGSSFEKADTNGKTSIATHDYPGVISALKKLIDGEVDIQAYESFCRKTAKDKVFQLIALPRLIDRCAEALVKVAKEDKVLSLYDLAQLKIMVRDMLLNPHCMHAVLELS